MRERQVQTMFSRFFTRMSKMIIMFFSVIFMSVAGHLWAFSVDVSNLSYSDDSGRSVIYDFSSGTVSNNAIQLPESSIISRDTGETGTTYIWGQVTGMSAISLSLDSVGKKATVGPVTEGEGVAILYADGTLPPQSTAPTWNYSLELSNFNFNTDVDGAYLFEIGLGRDEESGGSYNEAFVSVKWVKGYFDGIYTIRGHL